MLKVPMFYERPFIKEKGPTLNTQAKTKIKKKNLWIMSLYLHERLFTHLDVYKSSLEVNGDTHVASFAYGLF